MRTARWSRRPLALAALVVAALVVAALPLPVRAGVDRFTLLGPGSAAVDQIAVDPVRPMVLYGSSRSGLWKSADGGAHWRRLEAAPRDGLVVHDPVRTDHLYLRTYQGPWRSTDGGARWTKLPGLPVTEGFGEIAVAPSDPRVLYVVHSVAGLFRSADGGATFEHVLAVPLPLHLDVTIDPSNPDVLYSTGGSGLHKSTDGGHTLVFIGPAHAGRLAIDPRNPRRLWLTVDGSLVESLDGGATFLPIPRQPDDHPILDIALDRTDSRRALVATFRGVYRTRDGGVSWTALPVPAADPSTGFGTPRQILSHPRDPRALWLARDFATVLRSRNGGARWLPASDASGGLVGLPGTEILFDPQAPSRAVTATWAGVFASADSARTWTRIADAPTAFPRVLTRDTRRSGRLLLAGFDAGLFESVDDGRTWRLIDLGDAGPPEAWFVHRVLPVGSAPGEIYVASEVGLHRSFDNGTTWTLVNSGLFLDPHRSFAATDLLVDPGDPELVYTVVQGKLAWITGDRALWTVAHTPPGAEVTSLALDAFDPRVFHVGTTTGVFSSRDGGVTWNPATGGTPPAGAVRTVLALGNTVWAGTDDAVYRSRNGGATWARVTSSGQGPDGALHLLADPNNPARVLVQDRRGLTWTAQLLQAPAATIAGRFDVEVAWRSADGRHGVGRTPDPPPPTNAETAAFALEDPARTALLVGVSSVGPPSGFVHVNWQFSPTGTTDLDVEITISDRILRTSASFIARPGDSGGGEPRALLAIP